MYDFRWWKYSQHFKVLLLSFNFQCFGKWGHVLKFLSFLHVKHTPFILVSKKKFFCTVNDLLWFDCEVLVLLSLYIYPYSSSEASMSKFIFFTKFGKIFGHFLTIFPILLLLPFLKTTIEMFLIASLVSSFF